MHCKGFPSTRGQESSTASLQTCCKWQYLRTRIVKKHTRFASYSRIYSFCCLFIWFPVFLPFNFSILTVWFPLCCTSSIDLVSIVCLNTFIFFLFSPSQPREKGRMRFHKLQNVQIALDFLKHRQVRHITWTLKTLKTWHCLVTRHLIVSLFALTDNTDVFCSQVKLVNIRNDDIADGNPKLTLGLIWTIILHFQVSSSVSVVFHYIIALYLLSLGSVSCCFPSPWSQNHNGFRSSKFLS